MKRTPPHELSFADLRRANILRLPKFRGGKGQKAHANDDGSDWTPAQWLMAVVGELGEFAEVRWQYESGLIDYETYQREARGELADVQIYLDILAMRSMDTTNRADTDHAVLLMKFIMYLGGYANLRKKMIRGDIDHEKFKKFARDVCILPMGSLLGDMIAAGVSEGPGDGAQHVTHADPGRKGGVKLWQAVRDTFNKVSRRIGCGVELGDEGVIVGPDRGDNEVPPVGDGVVGVEP